MLTTTVCVALSAAGLALALLTAYRKRFLAATRIAALALIPVGLAMAGLADLAGDIAAATADWAADLVLKPSVWAGFAVLAVSAVLLVVTRIVGRRRGPSRTERRAASAGERRGAVAPGASAPSLGPGRAQGRDAEPDRKGGKRGGQDTGLEDFEDIEAILKKHGI
ncbi:MULTISPECIES: hypothetical protein [Streptomyces]|uniref:Cellulose synthase n=2 Tax=Streptomyces TaxID=1883 RepID=A0A3S5ILB0_9ACTN|nr:MULTISPECIES: hypothetical protein [Streptomyces]KNE80204.1 membrane protein [Streptomyces fradiae]OFA46571.1 hypothetical protein BEN35_21355 [Streptomyces fradiae]PQM22467.1 hypothetical protein Sfr7A_16155 [Streptomyces xinghaiensis]RKM96565.1 hypothetical protein SFRA_010950 [Streptomyces xinghaiensis]RNC74283.1 hypothetical protein DC095_011195 [Streptomyces xinghaiensis]